MMIAAGGRSRVLFPEESLVEFIVQIGGGEGFD
jgi:hypothetical protein